MKLYEIVGLRDKNGKKVHPNSATNIAMEFHYHNRGLFKGWQWDDTAILTETIASK